MFDYLASNLFKDYINFYFYKEYIFKYRLKIKTINPRYTLYITLHYTLQYIIIISKIIYSYSRIIVRLLEVKILH